MRSPSPWRRAVACAAALSCLSLIAPAAGAAPAPSLTTLDQAASHLSVGYAGPAVTVLQRTLNDWGVHSQITGRFSQDTVSAVALAARKIGMAAGNLVTQLAAIGFGPLAPQLQIGARGPEVATLQRALTRAGDGVEATAIFGAQTQAEVEAFQRAHGMAPNGIITLWQVEALSGGAAVTAPAPATKTQAPATAQVPPVAPPPALGATVARLATALMGKPYAWGGAGPYAFDCSGLVMYVYREATGRWLPHSSYIQWMWGTPVAPGRLQPGDLVFFNTDGWGPSHVGIYVGGKYQDFISATNPHDGVKMSSLYSAYWARHYIGARDLLH